jgi:ligand-binding SRPBCC domain-containing protein
MNTFNYRFTVRAPLAAVAEFHRDTRALQRLTPPPIVVQLHQVEPLGEGSVSEFTMWFGPLPVRWTAVHSKVYPLHGFTDTQACGPLQAWQHTHRFVALDDQTTQISERIEYEHWAGPPGWPSRLLFSGLTLRLMFAYRAWATRRAVEAGRPAKSGRKLQLGVWGLMLLVMLFSTDAPASAHRPVWDGGANGVMTIDNLSTSFAFYRDFKAPAQADVYTFEAKAGEHLHAGISVPALHGLESYGVSVAVLGPGLPAVNHDLLPENHPEDLGGLIFASARGEDFFEPFTQTNYWGRQRVELDLSQTGTYYLLVWQPEGLPGKYVLDTGTAEVFGPGDLLAFPVWWLKVHEFFGQTFTGPALVLGLVTVLALVAGVWLAWHGRKVPALQPVRLDEAPARDRHGVKK